MGPHVTVTRRSWTALSCVILASMSSDLGELVQKAIRAGTEGQSAFKIVRKGRLLPLQ